ncbi:hypothetical protein E4U13_000252 [Claviceps humidiphila]|uniref:Uncharacterized protein n=1 Tax=Claviceps humidiphila TaxID=1294629 RepID=A0A9P7TM78_9HYPO|nr:hypothetical protein E4U13_000252 [Claviceps humidiphila]
MRGRRDDGVRRDDADRGGNEKCQSFGQRLVLLESRIFFPKELFRRSVFAATSTSGLRVFEFHDSWEESACRPKVRGGWTGSPLRRAGIVAAASVTHVPPSAYVRTLWLIQRRRLSH